jgi:thioredoxin-related protein
MSMCFGRAKSMVAGLALLVSTAAWTVESPASTPSAAPPAVLFQHETVELAWEKASETKRPLVVMFTTDQCPHCERILSETYGDAAVRRWLGEHAETVLAHARDYTELTKKLGIRGYPTTLIVSRDGQIADAIEGFVDAPTFARRAGRWIGPGSAEGPAPVATASR